jgi:hypothetical protein
MYFVKMPFKLNNPFILNILNILTTSVKNVKLLIHEIQTWLKGLNFYVFFQIKYAINKLLIHCIRKTTLS